MVGFVAATWDGGTTAPAPATLAPGITEPVTEGATSDAVAVVARAAAAGVDDGAADTLLGTAAEKLEGAGILFCAVVVGSVFGVGVEVVDDKSEVGVEVETAVPF